MSKMKKKELEAMLYAAHQEIDALKAENRQLQANIDRLVKSVENLTNKK